MPLEPHPCAHCEKLTTNPKFCSRTCAGKCSMSSSETRQRVSQALIGRTSPLKGKTYEQIHGIEKAKRLRQLRREAILKSNPAHQRQGKTYDEIYGPKRAAEFKQQLSDVLKGRESPLKGKSYDEIHGPEKAEQLRQLRSEASTGRPRSREERDKQRQAQLAIWRDPKYAAEQRRARRLRPNNTELQLLALLKNNHLDFDYVGDFQLNLGGKFPDFVHKDKSLLIELFGNPWHEPEEEQERINHFAQFGYATLVIWTSELNNHDQVLAKVAQFTVSFGDKAGR